VLTHFCTTLDLLKNKSQPEAAANGAAAWVISERELRERLRKEKEARELKEKLDVSIRMLSTSPVLLFIQLN
jgi:hypothetical protein